MCDQRLGTNMNERDKKIRTSIEPLRQHILEQFLNTHFTCKFFNASTKECSKRGNTTDDITGKSCEYYELQDNLKELG